MNMLLAESALVSISKRVLYFLVLTTVLVAVCWFFMLSRWVLTASAYNNMAPKARWGDEISQAANSTESSWIYIKGIYYVNVCHIPKLQKWRERYDMVAFLRKANRYPVPFPWGMRLCYVKTDGSVHYLSDWESRRLANEYSKIEPKFKFNLMRTSLLDILFYVVLISLGVFAIRRGRRIRRLEEITCDRLLKLATLCVREKEERGRFPFSLDELKGVENGDLYDAATGAPFLSLTSVNDRFLVASPCAWFSRFFPFSFQKRYFVGCADGSVRMITGSICAKTAEKVWGQLVVRAAKENGLESNSSCDLSKRTDDLSKSLDGMTTICRRSLVLFIAFSQALFWFYVHADWVTIGLLSDKVDFPFGGFKTMVMFFYIFYLSFLFLLCGLFPCGRQRIFGVWKSHGFRYQCA